MNIKIQPKAIGLCATCRESHVTEYCDGTTQTMCFFYGEPWLVRKPVTRCNQYDHKGAMNKHELEKIAWTLRTDKSGKIVGFTAPKKKDDE